MTASKSLLWTAHDVAKATGGQLKGDWQAFGLSMDSRSLQPGDLFIALKGPVADGHHYVKQALAAGAACAIVEETFQADSLAGPLFHVPDTFKALQQLAVYARQRTKAKIIGVTGSYGKTSTKEALKHILSAFGQTYATERSFNNHWGVPFSLARLPREAEYGVFEIGMNHAGEIAPLAKMAQPEIVLITTIAPAHIGNFNSLDELAAAKAEIFQGFVPGGIAVLNYDNSYFTYLKDRAYEAGARKIISFGCQQGADIRLLETHPSPEGITVTAALEGTEVRYKMPVYGRQWADNSLGILGVLRALELDVEKALVAFNSIQPVEGRGVHHLLSYKEGKIRIIDESYNAGPVSMRAAIETLGQMQPVKGGRRIAVLGDMLELGAESETYHRELATILKANEVDLVFISGENMHWLYQELPPSMQGGHDEDVKRLAEIVRENMQPGDIIMIKGSRAQRQARGRMYAVVERLLRDHNDSAYQMQTA